MKVKKERKEQDVWYVVRYKGTGREGLDYNRKWWTILFIERWLIVSMYLRNVPLCFPNTYSGSGWGDGRENGGKTDVLGKETSHQSAGEATWARGHAPHRPRAVSREQYN